MAERFRALSSRLTYALGSPWSIIAAVVLVGAWVVGGIAGGFTDSWLLLMGTLATIVTFVMVFIIQASNNRSDKAIQLKLDALIAHLEDVPSAVVGAEDLTEQRVQDLTESVKDQASGTPRG